MLKIMANPPLGLADMKKLLLSARKRPTGADLTWHLQVQAFICVQLVETGIDGCCTNFLIFSNPFGTLSGSCEAVTRGGARCKENCQP
jgi:hypothetical protein